MVERWRLFGLPAVSGGTTFSFCQSQAGSQAPCISILAVLFGANSLDSRGMLLSFTGPVRGLGLEAAHSEDTTLQLPASPGRSLRCCSQGGQEEVAVPVLTFHLCILLICAPQGFLGIEI